MIWKTLPLLCALLAAARLRAEEEPRSKSKICANVFCGAGRECAVTEKGEPTCLCIEKCKPHKRPVCGSNGKTYLNHCELHRDACLTGSKIQVDYDGHCKEKKSENPAASPVVCYQSDRDELRRRVIQWLEAEIIPDGWFSKGSNYSEVLDKYFKSFDDGDSRLDSTEFLKFVEQNETAVNITTYMDQETNKLLRGLCVDALIELSDENADWKLSFNEFLKCLSPSFNPPEKSRNLLTYVGQPEESWEGMKEISCEPDIGCCNFTPRNSVFVCLPPTQQYPLSQRSQKNCFFLSQSSCNSSDEINSDFRSKGLGQMDMVCLEEQDVFNSAEINHVKSSCPDNLRKSDQTKVCYALTFTQGHTHNPPPMDISEFTILPNPA